MWNHTNKHLDSRHDIKNELNSIGFVFDLREKMIKIYQMENQGWKMEISWWFL